MGHGVHSTLASTLALGAFRYGRRRGLDLTVIAEHIDDAVAEHFHGDCFVTGHLARLDVATGELRWVNAGHPPPLLMRGAEGGGRAGVRAVPPLRAGDRDHRDRLTAGCSRATGCCSTPTGPSRPGPPSGDQFGLERLMSEVEQYIGAGVLPSETLRRLAARLRQHRGGELEDDATLVFLEWQPGR